MLIKYTSIINITQGGFLSTNTVNMTHLNCYILNREKKKTILRLKLLKTKLKNTLNSLDKCLILHTAYFRSRDKSHA